MVLLNLDEVADYTEEYSHNEEKNVAFELNEEAVEQPLPEVIIHVLTDVSEHSIDLLLHETILHNRQIILYTFGIKTIEAKLHNERIFMSILDQITDNNTDLEAQKKILREKYGKVSTFHENFEQQRKALGLPYNDYSLRMICLNWHLFIQMAEVTGLHPISIWRCTMPAAFWIISGQIRKFMFLPASWSHPK